MRKALAVAFVFAIAATMCRAQVIGAKAHNSVGQLGIPDGADVVLLWDATDFDSGSFHATPGRFIVPAGMDGTYLVLVNGLFATSGGADGVGGVAIYKDGDQLHPASLEYRPTILTGAGQYRITCAQALVLSLVAGDYVEAHAMFLRTGGANLVGAQYSSMAVIRLSP